MFFDFFGRKAETEDAELRSADKSFNKKTKWLIFAVVAAICILAFGGMGGDEKKEEVKIEKSVSYEEYIKNIEDRLEKMLETVKGAGTVKVMVTFDRMEEKVLAMNSTEEHETDVRDEGTSSKSSRDESVFLFDAGSEEAPFVLEEKLPVPSGVLVTATGAASEGVRLELYEAVKALFGISGHRIKISAAGSTK